MIAGADLSHQGISLIKFGYYTDFNQDWYFTNGDIMIVNMLINSVVPFVLILFIEFYQRLKIYRDNGGHRGVTKLKSVDEYLSLYGGQEFEIHYRYSNMMNIIYVTMVYGAAMPLLFLIALLSFSILYVQDTVLVVWFA